MLIIIFGFLLIFIAPENSFAVGVEVVQSDVNGLAFEYISPSYTLRKQQYNGSEYLMIEQEGAGRITEAGKPSIPISGILFQAPPEGDIHIEILEKEYEIIENCKVFPNPQVKFDDENNPKETILFDPEIYSGTSMYPGELVRIAERGILREIFVVKLLLFPFQWDPHNEKLYCYKRLKVKVRFDNPITFKTRKPVKSDTADNLFKKMFQSNVINYVDAKQDLSSATAKQDGIVRRASIDEYSEAVKISINSDGIYVITQQELTDLGLNVNPGDSQSIDPATFKLMNGENEVAISVDSNNNITFYARAMDNLFTDENIYWLVWNTGVGIRIGTLDGSLTGASESLTTFWDRAHFEEHYKIWLGTPNAPDADYRFWDKLTVEQQPPPPEPQNPTTKDYYVNVVNPAATQTTNPVVRARLHGISTGAHHVLVKLNGETVADANWQGETPYILENTFDGTLLLDGENIITLEMPGDSGSYIDVIYFDWVEVDYWRKLDAVDESLAFTTEDSGRPRMSIGNWASTEVALYDISDPSNASLIENTTMEPDSQGGYRLIFEDDIATAKKYYAMESVKSPNRIAYWHPHAVHQWTPEKLKSSENGADYIIITNAEFINNVQSLCQLRQDQGLRVAAVTTDQIFDEFNDGIFHPDIVKDFLSYAFNNWQAPAPTFVLMIGDSNLDYRDVINVGKENKVPVHLSYTGDYGLTPDDSWYVNVVGEDYFPDMFIGRISGGTTTQVDDQVQKIIAYDMNGALENRILLIADDNDPSYEIYSENMYEYIPNYYADDKLYLADSRWDVNENGYLDTTEVPAITNEIVRIINEGVDIVNFVGHGALRDWAGDQIFEPEDIPDLTNNVKLPFITSLNCLSGFFSREEYCLAEEFLLPADKGAIGCFAPSAYANIHVLGVLGEILFTNMFYDDGQYLGLITTESKIETFIQWASINELKMFNLFGDPATRLSYRILGDIDGDNSITLKDAIIVLGVLSSLIDSDSILVDRYEIDGDNTLGYTDLFYVLQYLSKLRFKQSVSR